MPVHARPSHPLPRPSMWDRRIASETLASIQRLHRPRPGLLSTGPLSTGLLSTGPLSKGLLITGLLTALALSGCTETPPTLTLLLAETEDQTLLEDIDTFTFQAEYVNDQGTVVKRGQAISFARADLAAQPAYDLETTSTGQRLVLRLSGTGVPPTGGEPQVLAQASSSPFAFTDAGPTEVQLFLGRIGAFSTLTQPLGTGRIGHSLTSLDDGTWLIAGGSVSSDGGASSSLELFDDGSASLRFGTRPLTVTLDTARVNHLAGRLIADDGTVSILLAGGDSSQRVSLQKTTYTDLDGVEQSLLLPDIGLGDSISTHHSVERYEPETGRVSVMKDLIHARSLTPTVSMSDGTVLFCGGIEQKAEEKSSLDVTDSCFRYSGYDNGSTTAVTPLRVAVALHQLTGLDDDYVVATGGMTAETFLSTETTTDGTKVRVVNISNASWLYRLNSTAVKTEANMKDARAAHSTVYIPGSFGQALVTGGYGRVVEERNQTPRLLDSAEIFDRYVADTGVASRAFVRMDARLNFARAFHTSVGLEDGRVLIIGGIGVDPSQALPVEIIDPLADDPQFEVIVGSEIPPLMGMAVSPVHNGEIVVTGGLSYGASGPSDSEVVTVRVFVP